MLGVQGIQKECDRCPHVEKPQKEQNAKQNKATHWKRHSWWILNFFQKVCRLLGYQKLGPTIIKMQWNVIWYWHTMYVCGMLSVKHTI